MTQKQLHVLQHSLGVDEYGQGEMNRNHFCAGGGDVDLCRELVALGFMAEYPASELTGGDPLFWVTEAGKRAMLAGGMPRRDQHLPDATSPELQAEQSQGRIWMSAALQYAHDTVRGLLPEDRLKLLHSMVRYCWHCGRVGLQNPAAPLKYSCAHCGQTWQGKWS